MRAVREPLAAIGLSLTILPLTNRDFDNDRAGVIAKGARADLWWGGLNAETGDPVDYLRRLFLPAEDWAEVNRIAKLDSPLRERASVALATAARAQGAVRGLHAAHDPGARLAAPRLHRAPAAVRGRGSGRALPQGQAGRRHPLARVASVGL